MAIKEIISRNSDLLIRFLHHALQDQSQRVFQQLPLFAPTNREYAERLDREITSERQSASILTLD